MANKVIGGTFLNSSITEIFNTAYIVSGFKQIPINKSNVSHFEIVGQNSTKSATSAIGRGIVGGILLGGVGLLAGSISAKNKNLYTITLYFRDGRQSLIEVDEKVYKAIVAALF